MLDLGDILGVPMVAGNEKPTMEQLVAVVIQQQEGIDLLTKILVEHKAKFAILEGEIRLLRARSDPPKRSSILRV